jgi:uncharacterized Zn finger protein
MAWWSYERTYRRPAKGGIKAQSGRSGFGQSWWAKRWIEVLEGFHLGSRLSRGRSYARSGQVVSIDIEAGEVTARVQGSRPKPYDVSIRIKPLSGREWKKVIETLSRQPLFTAKLLAGQMPEDIEKVFQETKVPLFPENLKAVQTDCSCPDWSNPCKHIAAVYYLLGEEFDRDPFLIFKLRGMDRDTLICGLGVSEGKNEKTEPVVEGKSDTPLTVDPGAFWSGAELPENLFGPVEIPTIPAAILKRLGNFPFWRGNQSIVDALGPLYEKTSGRGLEIYIGETFKDSKK